MPAARMAGVPLTWSSTEQVPAIGGLARDGRGPWHSLKREVAVKSSSLDRVLQISFVPSQFLLAVIRLNIQVRSLHFFISIRRS